jgi:predicted permease
MLKDLRHALRMLLRAPGWTLVVLLSLALGIGANTAIFSAINALLIKNVPVENPDTLVRLRWGGRNDMTNSSSDYGFSGTGSDGQRIRATFSYPMYKQLVADNRTMTNLFACAPYGRVNVVVDNRADIATAFVATGNYYRVLEVNARLGRVLMPEDDLPSAPPAAVISSRYWHSRFGTDPSVIGRTVRVNTVAVTIVGVLPPGFTGIQRTVTEPRDIEFPLSLVPQLNPEIGRPQISDGTYWWLQIAGRLKPGVRPEQVHGNLAGVFQHTARTAFDAYLQGASEDVRSDSRNRGRSHVPHLLVDSASRGIYEPNVRELRTATILAIVVGLVLLIVCANVANLLLSRAASRFKELSVRLSLGATRARLIRQMLTESLLLACAGGALGLAVGYWGRQLLPAPPGQLPPMDWRVLAFVLAISVTTGIIFGIIPAARASGADVNAALKQNTRSIAGSRSLLGKSLLVVQVAISLVLLVGAGLFIRTLQNLRVVDVGFNADNLLLFRVAPDLSGYDEKRTLALFPQLFERVGAVAGVRGVALISPTLLSGSVNSTGIFVHGRSYASPREDYHPVHRLVISPSFFDVMEVPIVAGRGFTARDSENAPRVAMINETAAKKYFPGQNPIGMRFGSRPENAGETEIIGIVRDTKYDSVREPAPPTMYQPHLQRGGGGGVIAVRTAVAPETLIGAVREAVRQIDPNLPVTDVSTQIEQIDRLLQQDRLFARAYALFGALALFLAAIGLFGLMSYNVSRRTNEIGIRMALGAARHDVLRLVMRESMTLVAIGIVIGVGTALWASRFVASQLFGVAGTDVTTVAAAVAVMLLAAAPAGFLPARRASGVDPMVALRYD